jgi:YVTN family beta-propeller protein
MRMLSWQSAVGGQRRLFAGAGYFCVGLAVVVGLLVGASSAWAIPGRSVYFNAQGEFISGLFSFDDQAIDVPPIGLTPVSGPSPNLAPGIAAGIAIAPDDSTVWVAVDSTVVSDNPVPGWVTPVQGTTAGTPIQVGGDPSAIAITPDGKTVYVISQEMLPLPAVVSGWTVTPIDTASDSAGTPIWVGDKADAIAITPDGKTAYVANAGDGTVTPIDLTNNTAGTPIGVGSDPDAIAITPDGKTAYVANGGDGTVTPIDTASNAAGAAIPVGTGASSSAAIVPDSVGVVGCGPSCVLPPPPGSDPDAIAITPDGKTAYVATAGDGAVVPIDTATNTVGTAIPVGGTSLAIGTNLPNCYSGVCLTGVPLYVGSARFPSSGGSTSTPESIVPIDTSTDTIEPAIDGTDGDTSWVAVAPDQGPTAAFSATAAPAGQASSFDASGSAASQEGTTVASYQWDFGDGSGQTTTSATTSHTYATPGTYTVRVTVTDTGGCSTNMVFTGQTAICNSQPAAQVSHQVIVPAPCSGFKIANQAAAQTGRPGKPGSWTFTVSAGNCTGAAVHSVKLQGGTVGWVTSATATTSPAGAGTVSMKGNTISWSGFSLANNATASITVTVTGNVPKGTACGSALPITGTWSASALNSNNTPVSTGASNPSTIQMTC